MEGVEEVDPNNSSAVTDAGANAKPLGTQPTLVPTMDKHKFTALPQWEFDDQYRLDPQFIRSVSTVDSNYREKFVNILLMWVTLLKKICWNCVLVFQTDLALEGFWALFTL